MNDEFDREDPEFDALARAAGGSLRQPPPPNGLSSVRGARRRRAMYQAGAGLAVGVVALTGIVTLSGIGEDQTEITSTRPDSTVPVTSMQATTQPAAPNPAMTVPGTTPATTAATSMATTPLSTSVPSTSAVPGTATEAAIDLDAELAGWNWDNSGIDRACGNVWWEQQQMNQLRCTQVVIDPQGVPVSYDPLTRRVTREHRTGVEPVAFVLPEDFVDPSLLAAGPDDVVYFALDNDRPSPSDVIAISLAPDDVGRLIERFPTVLPIGDADILVASTGLVVSGWYDQGLRPPYDATPVVEWVDRSGGVATPIPEGGFDDANNTVGANGWQWSIADRQVIAEQPGRSMVVPTFDGGFIAAYTETTGARRIELIRGWRDGTVEYVELPLFSPALVLEPQGTLLVPNGESFARIVPFEDPATGWDSNLQIDAAAGTATPIGLDEYLDTIVWPVEGQSHVWPWGTNPITFANAVAGGSPSSPSELRTIQQEPFEGSTVAVTVTTEGLLDDSVHGTRLTMHITTDQPGYRILRIDWSNTCKPGRGHQDYQADYCN